MQSEIQTQTDIKLLLTTEEAYWLKALCQNPINCTRDTELEDDRQIRYNFFEALPPFEDLI